MSGVGVRKIGVFLDIDGTLMIHSLEDEDVPEPWIGGESGRELIKKYLAQWTRRAEETGCELHVGVITNKFGPDDLVFIVVKTLESFLDLNHPYPHRHSEVSDSENASVMSWKLSVQCIYQLVEGRFHAVPLDRVKLDKEEGPEVLTGRNRTCIIHQSTRVPYKEIALSVSPKVILFVKPGIRFLGLPEGLPKETYQGYKIKADAMASIAKEHGIPPENCYLVDDKIGILKEVEAAGMNPISAECFSFFGNPDTCPGGVRSWYDGVNKKEALKRLSAVFENLSEQLEAKYFRPAELEKAKLEKAELEKAELEKSTGCAGAGSGLSPASSESFESVEIEGEDVKSPGTARVFYEILYAHGFNKAELDAEVYSAALGIFAK